VGDKVRVRDRLDEGWRQGVVAEVDARYPLKPRVKEAESEKVFVWNYCEPQHDQGDDDEDSGGIRATATSMLAPLSPTDKMAEEEEEGGDVVAELGVQGDGDNALPLVPVAVGTPATDPSVLNWFADLPSPVRMEKGEKVLCQRSSGEWCHAKVHSFDSWPPEGGTLTLQVDKYRRKVLDLSKARHLQRVRVAKSKVRALALTDPAAAAKTKESNSKKKGGSGDNRWDVSDEAPSNARLAEILAQESTHDSTKIALLLLSFIGVAGLDMAKELAPCGSQAYVLATALTIPYVLVFFFGYRNYLMKRQKEKLEVGYRFLEGDVVWDERSTIIYPLLCVFAGFFAGMFGVGGGIIKGPLMLEMGILPPVAAANAAAMILFTTATACLSFFLFGAVDYQVASVLFGMGVLCTGVGQFVLGVAIKRANRQSLIILSMAFVVIFSACLLTLRSVVDAATRPGGVGALVRMGSICGVDGGTESAHGAHGDGPHRKPQWVSPWDYLSQNSGGGGAGGSSGGFDNAGSDGGGLYGYGGNYGGNGNWGNNGGGGGMHDDGSGGYDGRGFGNGPAPWKSQSYGGGGWGGRGN